jgi:hypothetical protein
MSDLMVYFHACSAVRDPHTYKQRIYTYVERDSIWIQFSRFILITNVYH